jgi:hypothetical protein
VRQIIEGPACIRACCVGHQADIKPTVPASTPENPPADAPKADDNALRNCLEPIACLRFPFDNSYEPARALIRLPHPTPVAAPQLVRLNASAQPRSSRELASPEGAEVWPGTACPRRVTDRARHPGNWGSATVPQLGDGRVILLGEIVGRSKRRDI